MPFFKRKILQKNKYDIQTNDKIQLTDDKIEQVHNELSITNVIKSQDSSTELSTEQ